MQETFMPPPFELTLRIPAQPISDFDLMAITLPESC
jgi:hypothetical protein